MPSSFSPFFSGTIGNGRRGCSPWFSILDPWNLSLNLGATRNKKSRCILRRPKSKTKDNCCSPHARGPKLKLSKEKLSWRSLRTKSATVKAEENWHWVIATRAWARDPWRRKKYWQWVSAVLFRETLAQANRPNFQGTEVRYQGNFWCKSVWKLTS